MRIRRIFTCGISLFFFVLALIVWFVPPGRYPAMSQPIEPISQEQVIPSLVVLPTVAPSLTPQSLVTQVEPTLESVSVNFETESIPAATQPAPQPLMPGTVQYVVQPGETLYRIAVRYGMTAAALATSNGLSNPDQLLVGQVLLIPAASVTVVPPTPLYPTPDLPIISLTERATTVASTVLNRTPTLSLVEDVNGIPLSTFIVLPENVRQNIALIYATGRTVGRNPHAFSKLGDSTIENPHFLTRFDGGPFVLGDYAYLQSVIDYFQGSYGRQGVAVRRGLHSWSAFDPMWSDKSVCMGNETVIACEFRLNNPSYLFIRLGSNDVGVPESFDRNIRQVVEFSIQNGVIPIIGTKADRHEGTDNINNTLLRQIAADYQVPLWDFDLVASTLPDRGLEPDGVHMTTFFAHDYSSPVALQRGNGIHNLTALMALDAVWRSVDLSSQ